MKAATNKRPGKKASADAGTDKYLQMYRRMQMIRLFEEQVNELYTRALMPGLAHLYVGEEAVAVGICEALRPDDYITSTHRGHGHCVAKGAAPDRMFAELLGKEAGYCKGKGGSMHIADPNTRIFRKPLLAIFFSAAPHLAFARRVSTARMCTL